MDFSSLARRAVRVGLRRGADILARSLSDSGPEARTRRPRGGPNGSGTSGAGRGGAGDRDLDARGGTARRPGAGTRARGDRATGAQVRAGGDYQPARPGTRSGPKQGAPRRPSGGYPGDFSGSIRPVYTPDLDGDADPGEVVWAWVPYEEDFSRGKDRPVLIIGRDSAWLLGLMLTSRDHIPGGIGEMREADSALWMNVGTGDWDAQGRASEIRLDRVIRIAAGAVRREGAILPMGLFSQVVSNVRTS